jgi:hypothetical protein
LNHLLFGELGQEPRTLNPIELGNWAVNAIGLYNLIKSGREKGEREREREREQSNLETGYIKFCDCGSGPLFLTLLLSALAAMAKVAKKLAQFLLSVFFCRSVGWSGGRGGLAVWFRYFSPVSTIRVFCNNAYSEE